MKLSLVEVRTDLSEKFLVQLINGQEAEVLDEVKPVLDCLKGHERYLRNCTVDQAYARVNEVLINRLIAFEHLKKEK